MQIYNKMTPIPEKSSVGLKPCPFCGGESKMHELENLYNSFFVRCGDCRLSTNGYTKADYAVDMWNTRPRESELELALKIAGEALNEIHHLEKGLKHPSDCLAHSTDGDGCDCGKGMIEYQSRHALELLSRDLP